MINSRKLPLKFECPIDNFLLDIVDYTNPYFYKLGFTPNGLTFVSALFGIACGINCYYRHYLYSSVLHFIGYFFDCADGNFARRYHLTSKFGDFFDHIKDVVVGVLNTVVMIYNNDLNLYYYYLFIVLSGLNNLYLGEQEVYFKGEKSEFLQLFTLKSNFSLKFLRYFGCGTVNAYVSFLLFLLHFNLI
jgi:phosphatidylglycerophosphate synthase